MAVQGVAIMSGETKKGDSLRGRYWINYGLLCLREQRFMKEPMMV